MTQSESAESGEQRALIDEMFELQGRLALSIHRSALPEWVELELTMAQFKTAFVVAQRGPLSVNAIAEILGVTQSTVSHLVDRLAQELIVERVAHPTDRRRTLVRLAPRGGELMEALRQGQRVFAQELLSQLDLADLRALIQGFRALANLIQAQR
jgi:DNA-binding MarR family transcriptional regulator